MLDKLKQMNQLREIQKAAQAEKFQSEDNGVTVVVNGALQIESVTLNSELAQEDEEKALLGAVNQALRQAQMSMAQKFSGLM